MRDITVRMTAGVMTVFMLGMSVLPGLAAAQTVDESSATTSSTDAVQADTISTGGYEVVDTPETNHSLTVTSSEVEDTLSSLDGLLDESSTVVATTDADSAVIVETDSGSVDIPKDAADPVVFAAEGTPSIEITLPNSNSASDAKTIDDGVVAYAATDGSANAVQATEDGGVKMLTVIDNASAPTEYTYGITVPEGGSVELTSDGGAVVLDSDNSPIAVVDTPWATDASGNSVETYFTTDGVSLTQHVLHTAEGVVYPVTADPRIYLHWWGISTYIEQYNVNRLQALLTAGAGAAGIATALSGGSAGLVTGVAIGIMGIGTGVIQWCSAKGRGMWIYQSWIGGAAWCTNG